MPLSGAAANKIGRSIFVEPRDASLGECYTCGRGGRENWDPASLRSSCRVHLLSGLRHYRANSARLGMRNPSRRLVLVGTASTVIAGAVGAPYSGEARG